MRDPRRTIALAQIDCTPGDVAANVDRIVEVAERHADDADLIVSPEYATTGHGLGEEYFEAALRRDDPPFERLVEASTRTSLAVGFIEESDDYHLYNSLAFLRNGDVAGVHRKAYLQNYGIFEEKKYFAPADDYEILEIDSLEIAPLICGDAWNPGLVHVGALAGADVFVVSACSPGGGLGPEISSERNWRRLNRLVATVYGCYVLFVNRTGTDGETSYWGGSELVDPFGEQVAEAGESEEVVTAEIDLDRVRQARRVLFTTRDERLDFLRRQFRGLEPPAS